MSADDRRELVELLARALLADMRKYPDLPPADEVTPITGAAPSRSEDHRRTE
jgi:hypothetical protein